MGRAKRAVGESRRTRIYFWPIFSNMPPTPPLARTDVPYIIDRKGFRRPSVRPQFPDFRQFTPPDTMALTDDEFEISVSKAPGEEVSHLNSST